ncbi:MAG: hypothetical protein JW808_08005 [Victivallales bacterium]|nr:hypothetical protein [Victivallales bacterium]
MRFLFDRLSIEMLPIFEAKKMSEKIKNFLLSFLPVREGSPSAQQVGSDKKRGVAEFSIELEPARRKDLSDISELRDKERRSPVRKTSYG